MAHEVSKYPLFITPETYDQLITEREYQMHRSLSRRASVPRVPIWMKAVFDMLERTSRVVAVLALMDVAAFDYEGDSTLVDSIKQLLVSVQGTFAYSFNVANVPNYYRDISESLRREMERNFNWTSIKFCFTFAFDNDLDALLRTLEEDCDGYFNFNSSLPGFVQHQGQPEIDITDARSETGWTAPIERLVAQDEAEVSTDPYVTADIESAPLPGSFKSDTSPMFANLYPGVLSFMKDMSGKAEEVWNLPTVLTGAVGSVTNSVKPGGSVTVGFENVKNALLGVTDTFKEKLQELSDGIPTKASMFDAFMKYILPCVSLVLGMFQHKSKFLKIAFWSSVTALAIYWGKKAFEFSNLWGVQHQAGKSVAEKVLDVVRPFFNLAETKDQASSFLKRIQVVFSSNGAPGTWLSEVSCLPFIIDKILVFWRSLKDLIGWSRPDYRKFQTGHSDVDAFVAQCVALLSAREVEPTGTNVTATETLFNMTGDLRRKYAKDTDVMRIISDFYPKLEKLHMEFLKIRNSGPFSRPDPTGLLLVGGAGCGKSTAHGIIVDLYLKARMCEETEKLSMYMKHPDYFRFVRIQSPYFEGIHPSVMSIEYPDFGACKQNENSGVQHEAELINLISSEFYTPNMAFETKGKLRIAPELVSGTSNNSGIEGSSARHKPAIERRLIVIRQTYDGPGGRPLLGAPLDVNKWRFQVMKCNQVFAYEPDLSVKVMNIYEVVTFLLIHNKLQRASFVSQQNVIAQGVMDTGALMKRVEDLDLKPGGKIRDYVSSLFDEIDPSDSASSVSTVSSTPTEYAPTSMVTVDLSSGADVSFQARYSHVVPTMKDQLSSPSQSGSWTNFIGSADVTEDSFVPFKQGGIMNVRALSVHATAPMFEGGVDAPITWIESTKGELNARGLSVLLEGYKYDPVGFADLLLGCPATCKHPASQILQKAVENMQEQNKYYFGAGWRYFYDLYERKPVLAFWCLVNPSDFEAFNELIKCKGVFTDMQAIKSFFAMFKEKVYDQDLITADKFYSYLALFSLGLGIVGSFAAIAGSSGEETQIQPVQDASVDQASAYLDPKALQRNQRRQGKKFQAVQIKPTSLQSPEVIGVAVQKTMYHQWQLRDSKSEIVSTVVALGDRDFLMNAHTFRTLRNTCPEGSEDMLCLWITRGAEKFLIPFSELLSGIVLEEFDTYWVRLKTMPQCVDILPHWVPDGFVEDLIHDSNNFFGAATNIFGKGPESSRTVLIAGRTTGGTYTAMLFNGHFDSNIGDCGSLLFGKSVGVSQGKFMGILHAGEEGPGEAYFCAIPSKMIVEMRARLSGYVPKARSDGKKVVIGNSSTPHNFHTTVNDILTPSEYPAKEPFKASVAVNDPKVYEMARAKYCPGFEPEPLAMDRLKVCVMENLAHWWAIAETPLKPGMLSMMDAIVGFENSYIRGIPLNTSAGAPFNVRNQNKDQLLGHWDHEGFKVGPNFSEIHFRVGSQFEQLLKGNVPMDVFTDVVKSEILPKEKVAKGKGRIVSACGVTRTIVSRMIWGRFWEWIFANHLTNGISAGDNMQGPDAHLKIMKHWTVAAGEPNHCTGDLSANDARQVGTVMQMTLLCIRDFMAQKNCVTQTQFNLMTTHAQSYLHQFHIRGGLIDMWNGSLSSGDPNTTGLNSITNPAYGRYSIWKSLILTVKIFTSSTTKTLP